VKENNPFIIKKRFNKMKKITVILVIILVCLLLISNAYAQLKKRVAVFTFENKSAQGWHWWDGRPPGDGMADMLTTELVKSGNYVVIERQEINSLLDEQRLGQTGVVTSQSAAQVGKMLGVELAIVGAVTEFGHSRGDTGVRIKGIGVGGSKQKATVAVDVRFVNTSTGEILAAENVRKEESKTGLRLSLPEFGFNNRNDFDNSIVGKATRAAIDDIVGMIENQMENIPWQGKIIKVDGTTIYMKPGSDAGVKIGDSYAIYAKGEDLIDPDTGLSLGSEETKVGSIEVTSIIANGKAAKAVIKMGSGFKIGDFVRLN
jgi:curli biogenesis system outer membrane secretion channel CsgG